ncbi:MAG: VCBS repeat-containing protein [Spirosomataceae bacterium]
MTKIIVVAFITTFLIACNTFNQSEEQTLAQSYCGGCHQLPTPDLLDKKTWSENVLPKMALRLGIEQQPMNFYSGLSPDEIVAITNANIFPEKAVLSKEEWDKIVKYYIDNAPEKLPDSSSKYAISASLTLFTPKTNTTTLGPWVSMLYFDNPTQKLFVGTRQGKMYILNEQFRQIDSINVGSPPADMHLNTDGSIEALLMGDMDPNDRSTGSWTHFQKIGKENGWKASLKIGQLRRPVQQLLTDIDADGLEDALICEFGFHIGQFSWYKQQKGGTYQAFQLEGLPGARLIKPYDFNRDGLLDFFVLMAQGDEQISVFYNKGNGRFEKQILLRFPPVYGSSYADLIDFNGDGAMDILYTNGDNADYSMILKPYHGLRIFMNDGHNHFKEEWFFGLNGAAKALAEDFDKDGDMDIVAVSYFPGKPQEGFVYFENQGNMNFKAQTFKTPKQDKWMLLEKADIDQDGDMDVLLGYLERPPYQNLNLKDKTGLMVLENRTK